MRASGTAGLVAALVVVGVLTSGCGNGNTATEDRRTFIDRHGRVCTYIFITESEGDSVDSDVSDLECDFPPPPPTPSSSP
ncbi:hypothetical protein SAMN04489712_101498 [Thermomonospora echinospora]|uniref:Uncharacterized protein n=1 Tax=Thermomonospora echinospora TaxID=1992 RepID=A0A1H5T642_9ACTN|nr:hypothetical protein [Thermomonospora echinospora]SEF58256.1 hypothetical protein SAMN04489712_101498 [Thermomonospora echinospora]